MVSPILFPTYVPAAPEDQWGPIALDEALDHWDDPDVAICDDKMIQPFGHYEDSLWYYDHNQRICPSICNYDLLPF